MRQHVIAVLLSSLASVGFAGDHRALAADRSPEEIPKEIEQVKFPDQDQSRIGDDDYGREWKSRHDGATEKCAAPILDFYKAAPEHEKVPSLMFMRWDTMISIGKRSSVESEIDHVLATTANEKLKREAAFERLRLDLSDAKKTGVFPIRQINEYLKLERKLKSEDIRAPGLLLLASRAVEDDGVRRQIENRILFAIPAYFVIDPAGSVYSTEARGKLETIIPELIEAREQGQFDNPVRQPKSRVRRNRKSN